MTFIVSHSFFDPASTITRYCSESGHNAAGCFNVTAAKRMEKSLIARTQFGTWEIYVPENERVERDDGPDEASDGEWEAGETEIIMLNGQAITFIH